MFLPGLMQLMPQAPSQRHFFFLLLQSSSEEHFRRHFWPKSVAWSSSRGQRAEGEFLGFLYTLPSSSASLTPPLLVPPGPISVESKSSSRSSSSSSSSGGAVDAVPVITVSTHHF